MFASLAVVLALGAVSADETPTRVLLIDIDDVGFSLLSDAPTPELDRAAANGRTFTSFTTSPLCSPTRAMMMTGAYPSHPDLLLGTVLGPVTPFSMPIAPLVPLPRLLSDAGLSTAKVGKWHLCALTNPTHPNDAGFGYYAGALANPGPIGDYWNYTKTVNGVQTDVTDRYMTIDETDDAIAQVKATKDFVSVSYHCAHSPYHEPPAHLHTIESPTERYDLARAMVEALDREIGRLLREALPRGYTVLILSDNGTPKVFRGGKGTVFDRGILAPLIAIGPGVAPGVDDTLIGAEDVYATVADLFDVSTAEPNQGPHSESFAPALAGTAMTRRWTYTEKFRPLGADPREGREPWLRAVRGKRFKLVDEVNGAGEAFYDVQQDPAETVDLLQVGTLSEEASAALAALRAVMERL